MEYPLQEEACQLVPEACYYAGLAHEKSGDAQNAKKMYQKFLKLDASDSERAKRAEAFIKNN